MGRPNYQRLAELGQLPEHMKPIVSADIVDANNNAIEAKESEPNKEFENIESVISDSKEEDLSKKSNRELRNILEEKGLDSTYAKNKELIKRILTPEVKEEEKKEEVTGEFVDQLLQ